MAAGTGLHAPHLPFAIAAGIGSIGWKAAVAWRRFDDEDAPKQEFGAAEI